MDVLKIRHPVGTVIKDVETGEVLVITSYSGNRMYLEDAFTKKSRHWDYWTLLGTVYVKDKTAQVLYGNKGNNRVTWSV